MLLLCAKAMARSERLELTSPNGQIKVVVSTDQGLGYSVFSNGSELFSGKTAMQLRGETLGEEPKLSRSRFDESDSEIRPAIPYKCSAVRNNYKSLTLDFKENYAVEFRAFDDGIAYRFITKKRGLIDVINERFDLRFPETYRLHLQPAGKEKGFKAVYEENYLHVPSNDWGLEGDMAVLPILIDCGKGRKVLFSEVDVNDYPHIFLKQEGNGAVAALPPAPTKMEKDSLNNVWITEEADYIARTKGMRPFPWRMFIVTERDEQLLESTMVARLAPQCALSDVSWIKPGQAFWDYINRSTDYGPYVTYDQGINTPTYKRYIDFASRNKIPYVLIDAGWSVDHSASSVLEVVPELDLQEVIDYGKSSNVGIVLWMFYHSIQKDLWDDSYNLMQYYSDIGAAGFKIDFMDRSDQWITNFYDEAAKEAAKHHMLIEFHGSFTPVGLEYKYPNVLSYEGVRGLEYSTGTTPENSIYLPFIRNVVGPTSFTPGSMLNTQPEHLSSGWGYNWATIGTRVHHMAYYILLDSGMQMIADSPRRFEENPDCSEFIFSVPVTWDETRGLAAETGEYAVVAKRKGNKWWIGGLTRDTGRSREIEVALDFLPEGRKWHMTSFEDGPNANGQAMDYNVRKLDVSRGDKLRVMLARNGGWAAVIE